MLTLAALIAASASSGAFASPGVPSLSGWEITGKSFGFVEFNKDATSYKDAVKRNATVAVPLPFNIYYAAKATKAYAVIDGVRDESSLVTMSPGQAAAAPVARPRTAGKKKMQVEVCDAANICVKSAPVDVVIFDTIPEFAGDLPNNAHKANKPRANTTDSIVGTYFPTWAVYDRKFDVSMMPLDNLTHVLYGFVPICGNNTNDDLQPTQKANLKKACEGTPNHSVVIFDLWGEIFKPDLPGVTPQLNGVLGQMMAAKKRNPDLKILPSIGGWTLSDPFYEFDKPENRKIFVDSTRELLLTWKFFDGLDIDWEFPGGKGANKTLGNSETDGATYVALMKELREMLTQLSQETGRSYELTSAIGAGQDKLAIVDYKAASEYMDYIFDMTYDFSGAFDTTNLSHQANLFAPSWDKDRLYSTDNSIKALIAQGVDPKKLIVGVAKYGRGWTGISNMTDPNNPFTGTPKGTWDAKQSEFRWEPGNVDYRGIKQFMLGADGQGINGFTAGYDSHAEAAYAFNQNTGMLVTFDDARSTIAKGQYVIDQQLGGVFSWEISGDNEGDIMNAMHEGLGHPLADGMTKPVKPVTPNDDKAIADKLVADAKAAKDAADKVAKDAADKVAKDAADKAAKDAADKAAKDTADKVAKDAADKAAKDAADKVAKDAADKAAKDAADKVAKDAADKAAKDAADKAAKDAADKAAKDAADKAAKDKAIADAKTHPIYPAGMPYKAGQIVQNNGALYQCNNDQSAGWCNISPAHYAPGTGSNWADAWSKYGDVAVVVVKDEDKTPVVVVKDEDKTPVVVVKDEAVAYKAGTTYKGGDIVSNNGGTFECKPFPFSGWCGIAPAAYAPGTGSAWEAAWIKLN
ncbi:glycosyl hydrolase family 18 protein [Glaciimonas sp. GG7]